MLQKIKEIKTEVMHFFTLLSKIWHRICPQWLYHTRLLRILGVILLVILGLAMFFTILWNTRHTIKRLEPPLVAQQTATHYMTQQLDQLSAQLQHLHTQLGAKNLQPLQEQVTHLLTQTQQLADKSTTLITQAIQAHTQTLQQQLQMIQAQLKTLQKQQQHVQYLKPKDLPFKITALDNIQQHDVVTARYDHQDLPLDVGDHIAGWELLRADFVKQQAEFVNHKQQHVIVSTNAERL